MSDARPAKKLKSAGPLKSALKKSKIANATYASQPDVKSFVEEDMRLEVQVPNDKVASKHIRSPPLKSSTKEKGKAKAIPDARSLPSTFKIVAGCYERLLYGLEGSFADEEGKPGRKLNLKPVFIFPAHIACVKAVSASPDGGKWLATGSTDESVKIWDLRRRKEHGSLSQHEGSITHLSFPTRSHLISASEDGTICIFHTRDWVLLRSLKGHKGRVNSVAVHPSGKVALSVGKDRTLRMWDLMRGKGSASTKLGKEGELVRWSSKGSRFVVQTGSTLDIYSTDMVLLHTLTHPARVQDVCFCSHLPASEEKEYLLVAADDKIVTFYDTSSTDSTSLPIAAETIAHNNRVKAIDILSIAVDSSLHSWTTILSTVSSDGFIRVFDLGQINGGTGSSPQVLEAIAEYDTKGSRLTCCTLADGEIRSLETKAKRSQDNHDDFNGFSSDGDAGDTHDAGEEDDNIVD